MKKNIKVPKTNINKHSDSSGDNGINLTMAELVKENESLRSKNKKLLKQYNELKDTLRLLADTCPDLLWAKDAENKYIFTNKAICEKLLIANNTLEPVGKTDLFFANRQRQLFPENPNYHTFGEICSDTDEIIKTNRQVGKFDEFGNVQGKFLYLNVHKAPVFDKEGNVIGTIGSGRIVTNEKETEKALLESEQKFRSLAQNISDIIIRFNTDSSISFANTAALKLLKFRKKDLSGKKLIDAGFPEPITSFCLKNIQEVISLNTATQGLCQVPTSNNLLIYNFKFTPEYNEQGDIFSILAIAHDISDLVKSRQFLELEEIRLNSLLKLSRMENDKEYKVYEFTLLQSLKLSGSKFGYLGFFDTKRNKLILYAKSKEINIQKLNNRAFPEIDIPEGTYCYQVIHSHEPAIINSFNAPINLGNCFTDWKQQIFRMMVIPVMLQETVVSVLMVSNKEADYNKEDLRQLNLLIEGFRNNLQKRNFYKQLIEAKEKAEESDRLKSAFLANMSHEIRTPMNGIIGFAELMAKPGLPEDKRSKYLNIINSSAHQLLNIISDIVDISKIEAGQMDITKEKCNLTELLVQMEQQFELELKSKQKNQIKLHFSIPDNQISIYTDKFRLSQILSNLLGNAVKFTEKGTISLGYQYTNNKTRILFHVKDTGIGIPADKQKAIFERFHQADNQTSRKYGGTGLGLSISRGLAELLGGKLWVESEAGKGSVFYLSIPVNK